MPFDHADETDPMELTGVELPGSESVTREMSRCMAEEFARMGFEEARILALFQDPFYSGPHRAWTLLGEKAIREIVAEASSTYGLSKLPKSDRHNEGVGAAPECGF